MLVLQVPTPTPVPSSQIVQAVQTSQNIIQDAVNQGIVGVLLLLGIAAALFALGYALNAYWRRNEKSDSSGMNEAITAMAESTTRADEREERREKERQQERAEWRKIIEKQFEDQKTTNEKYIAAMTYMSDGYNRNADVLQGMKNLQETVMNDHRADSATISALRADVNQMVSVGSIPLRNLVLKVDNIEHVLNEIKTSLIPCPEIQQISDQDRNLFKDVLEAVNTDIELLRSSMLSRIEDVRKTDTGGMKPVQPETPPIPAAPIPEPG